MLAQFYAKTDGKLRLNFMLELADDMDLIKTVIKEADKEIMILEKKKQVFDKVLGRLPEGIKITYQRQQRTAQSVMNSIFNRMTDSTAILRRTIRDTCSEMAMKSLTGRDSKFDHGYEKWKKYPIKRELLDEVIRERESFDSKKKSIFGDFNFVLKKVYEGKKVLDGAIDKANSLVEKILKSSDSATQSSEKMTGILERIVDVFGKTINQQQDLKKKLEKLIETLQEFNDQHLEWAKFLIGKSKKNYDPMKTNTAMVVALF